MLRPPVLTCLKWAFPIVIAPSLSAAIIDAKYLTFATILLAPFVQWLIVFLLYGRFAKIHGREPRDVFMKAAETPDSGPDAMLLWTGLVALTVLPAGIVLVAAKLTP